jgi:hypothetical protein
MKIISYLRQKLNKGLNKMDKNFRNDEGVELTASNEIQAAAYEKEGFTASKSGAKAKAQNMEFASEMTPNAQEMKSMGLTADEGVNAKDMQTVQAQPSANNTFATEFSQELGANSFDVSDESQAQADAKANAKTNKTKK